MSEKKIVVMKFGGTSVATAETRACIVERVREAMADGFAPALVVSAMGRKGAPYATDTLLSLVEGLECPVHETDILVSVGETISTVVMASTLRAAGIPARAFSGFESGVLTDGVDGSASVMEVYPARIIAAIDAGEIPVIAGFQGIDAQGRINTLGRGGSDTSACVMGVALGAARVDIFSDVDGVMTADPRVEPKATLIECISSEELYQMADAGSKIVHPAAAELAFTSGIPLRVCNTFNDTHGTDVVDIAAHRAKGVATAVSTVKNITRLRVRLPYAKTERQAHMDTQAKVFRLLADAGISIDMFTPMNDRIVACISSADAARAVELLAAEGLEVAAHPDLAKVTVVGSGMHGVPGVMARVAECLDRGGIDILQVADSHATISALIHEREAQRALNLLHEEFALDE